MKIQITKIKLDNETIREIWEEEFLWFYSCQCKYFDGKTDSFRSLWTAREEVQKYYARKIISNKYKIIYKGSNLQVAEKTVNEITDLLFVLSGRIVNKRMIKNEDRDKYSTVEELVEHLATETLLKLGKAAWRDTRSSTKASPCWYFE